MATAKREQGAPERTASERERLLIIIGILWLLLGVGMFAGPFAAPSPVVIEWQTETERNIAGFHIYRGEAESGTFERINEQLIPARGSSIAGDTYTFVDENVEAGTTYTYRLVDVELDNTTQEQQVFQHHVPQPGQWTVALALFSIVAGLLLLIQSYRKEKSNDR